MREAKRRIKFIILMFVLCIFPYSLSVKADTNVSLEDGEYDIAVNLEGGSGKAYVTSPTVIYVEDGNVTARIIWSSNHYDYMLVAGEKYYPVNIEGNSTFEIPVHALDEPMEVVADTTAMSTPHEITYTLTFDSKTVKKIEDSASLATTEETNENIDETLNDVSIDKSSEKTEKGIALPVILFGVILCLGLIIGILGVAKKKRVLIVCSAFFIIGAILCLILGKKTIETTTEIYDIPSFIGDELTWQEKMDIKYATEFSVDYYYDSKKQQYKLITIYEDGQYLVLPSGVMIDESLLGKIPKEITLVQDLHQIYLVASPAMNMFVKLGALDLLQFSGQDIDNWSDADVKSRMEEGALLYAGKYSTPDYELIVDKGCDFVIENTMIYHTPEVKEKLESFDIPVMVDRSSYEKHPLGRTEWIKLYGALTDREEMAQAAFDEQQLAYEEVVKQAEGMSDTPTVAFFYLSPNGEVKVRKSGDYLPKMIELAGGEYIFKNLGDDSGSSTVTLSMEEFYATAKDADYIIYNSSIVGELDNLNDLLEKNELLKNMKAVKDGHVYCTSENLYQSPMELGTIIGDIYKMFVGQDDMTYLFLLK